MIVGSGLIAAAFAPFASTFEHASIYAAGVSNSSCRDDTEFERDRRRLETSIAGMRADQLLVYFSTCSVLDPWSQGNSYTAHKLHLEGIALRKAKSIVVRLPQVAGSTPNPHTLLNYLYNRIVRSERFDLWRHASRNIIDVTDVARIVADIIANGSVQPGAIVNVANPRNFTMPEIVAAMESATSCRAIYNLLDKGGDYTIDVANIRDSVQRCGITFDDGYLARTVGKYYE